MKKRVKRKKAFWGAVIGAGISLAGSLIGSNVEKNKANNQLREQQRAQNRRDTFEMAQNIQQGYSDQDYVDQFNKRISYKCGGKIKRRKAEAGGNFDWSSVLTGGLNALGSIGSAGIASGVGVQKDSTVSFANKPKDELKVPDYRSADTLLMRYGGKKCKRKCR